MKKEINFAILTSIAVFILMFIIGFFTGFTEAAMKSELPSSVSIVLSILNLFIPLLSILIIAKWRGVNLREIGMGSYLLVVGGFFLFFDIAYVFVDYIVGNLAIVAIGKTSAYMIGYVLGRTLISGLLMVILFTISFWIARMFSKKNVVGEVATVTTAQTVQAAPVDSSEGIK